MSTDFLVFLTGLLLALAGGYFLRFLAAKSFSNSLEQRIQKEFEAAKKNAKAIVEAAEKKAHDLITEARREEHERSETLRRKEEHLLRREDTLDKKMLELESRRAELEKEFEKVKVIEKEATDLKEKVSAELEKISGLSREEALAKLIADIEMTSREEIGKTLARLEKERKDQIDVRINDIIVTAIQRYAREKISDVTTSIVHLPNEEIKGKIIGREGRNIRAFEKATGVEVIIDETPESLLLSSFDPIRREIAKIALEKLLKDGRIQPVKIEEKVEEAKNELDDRIRKIGEEAAYEVGILDLPKEITYLLGRLNYRTSYGQNVLIHSIEMAHIAGMIAAELKLNYQVAKKAALLHDIGKAIDHEVEGTHVEIGRKLLKKYGIDEAVIRAMEAHHEEYPFATPEAYIVAAADAISAARPGARRDTLEKYLRRLEDIERVVKSFDGVSSAYAVAAGREVRVFVVPEKIDDFGALTLAKAIAQKIQSDVQYPGEIKVTVIREVKAVEFAR